jgi:lipoate-protein ligase A
MRHFPGEESIWMFWQTDNCVMLGSNQVAGAEIDLEVARAEGIAIVRRSSGGGAIFTDAGTLQYTVILPYSGREDVKKLEQEHIAAPMLDALHRLGIPARLEGRNDILLEGKKVSGLAQFVKGRKICNHGSLLYATDLALLAKALRPDEGKISTKALRSVRGRVARLADYLPEPVPTEEFRDLLKEELFRARPVREYVFSQADLASIEATRLSKYANPEWTFGKAPPFSYHNQQRFPLGKVEVFLEVKKGLLVACKVQGDFLGLAPICELETALAGRPYQKEALREAIKSLDLGLYLGGITGEELLSCLFE